MQLRRSTTHSRRAGFTLIELLVVVGIIVLLAGLLLPMLYKTFRSASRTRLAADLNTIGTALDAYKSDFGDYPRVTVPGTGFAVLGKALIGPYDAGTTNFQAPSAPYKAGMAGLSGAIQQVALRDTGAAPGGTDWANFGFTDGADGPGFRTRYDPTRGLSSKITNPYLPADKFKRQGLALLDHNGGPIMYFPASSVKMNLNQATGFYISSGTLAPGSQTLFNFDDNGTLATSLTPQNTNTAAGLARMQAMMGLRTLNNPAPLPAGKQPVNVPYLLWSPGADGIFGTFEDLTTFGGDAALIDRAVRKSDDVTNFPLPQ